MRSSFVTMSGHRKNIKDPVLVVSAHCDDETIFFGSLILSLSQEKRDITLLWLAEDRAEDAFNIWHSYKKILVRGLKAKRKGFSSVEEIVNALPPWRGTVITHGADGEYNNGFHKNVHVACLQKYGTILARKYKGDISFDADKRKGKILSKYTGIRHRSWNKYIVRPERYSWYLS